MISFSTSATLLHVCYIVSSPRRQVRRITRMHSATSAIRPRDSGTSALLCESGEGNVWFSSSVPGSRTPPSSP